MIGLTETRDQYEARGYTPLKNALGYRRFRRFGMPFAPQPKARLAGTARACRAVVAVRLAAPEREWAALRALQVLQFCTPELLDDDAALRRALSAGGIVDGIDLDAPEVTVAYEADRAESRTAAGTPTEAQGKAATTDGPVRYTAPSLIFEHEGRKLEAGGFQPLAAYDVVLANLAPQLERRPAPEDLGELVAAFPGGLFTAEVAECRARGAAGETDLAATEDALLELVAAGRASRVGVGEGAQWLYPARGWLPSDT